MSLASFLHKLIKLERRDFHKNLLFAPHIMRMILNKSQLSLPLPLLPIFRLLQVDLLTMEITKKIIRSYLVWSRRNVFCLAFGLFISIPNVGVQKGGYTFCTPIT